jgi:hypothetical protein
MNHRESESYSSHPHYPQNVIVERYNPKDLSYSQVADMFHGILDTDGYFTITVEKDGKELRKIETDAIEQIQRQDLRGVADFALSNARIAREAHNITIVNWTHYVKEKTADFLYPLQENGINPDKTFQRDKHEKRSIARRKLLFKTKNIFSALKQRRENYRNMQEFELPHY